MKNTHRNQGNFNFLAQACADGDVSRAIKVFDPASIHAIEKPYDPNEKSL